MKEEIIITDIEKKSGTSYIAEINKIQSSNQPPEIKLDLLDVLVKDYLRKKYHIRKNTEYEEMIEFFLEKKIPNLAAFCHEMILALYSGDMASANNIAVLLEETKSMIEKEEGSSKTISTKIKGIFSPLFGKKPAAPSQFTDTESVSKQTKKVIDKYLEENAIKNQLPGKSIADQTPTDQSVMYELNPALVPDEESSSEKEEYKNIRNIDDLENIKKKIKQRKIIVRKEKKSEE